MMKGFVTEDRCARTGADGDGSYEAVMGVVREYRVPVIMDADSDIAAQDADDKWRLRQNHSG